MQRLIEKELPIGFLSEIAEAESWRKEVYRPTHYIHKWWARRLGSVFRGIILGALLKPGDDLKSSFYSKNEFKNKLIFDPFMGSGITLGEAIKLGCTAIGRDINPVAFSLVATALEDHNFAEVEQSFQEIRRLCEEKIRKLFECKDSNGHTGQTLYYFMAKQVECPKCDENLPLFRNRVFSKSATPKKDKSARFSCPSCFAVIHGNYNQSEATCDGCGCVFNPQKGNHSAKNTICNCGHSFKLLDEIDKKNKPLNHFYYAKLILSSDGNKEYLPIDDFDQQLIKKIEKQYKRIEPTLRKVSLAAGYNTNQAIRHNYKQWHMFFTKRQLICRKILLDAISTIEKEPIRRLFAVLMSGVLEFNNVFASFKGEGTGAVRHMFSHHILKPELQPIEANMWGTKKSSGSFSTLYESRIKRALSYKEDPFELKRSGGKTEKIFGLNKKLKASVVSSYTNLKKTTDGAYVSCGDSSITDLPDKSIDAVITDPPFFDNVHYSQLADFFHYTLNDFVDSGNNKTTRSLVEVQDTDCSLFTKKLTSVFDECNRVLKDDGLFIFTYHHSRNEGWVAVHEAIRNSKFRCVQSFPIKAEMSVSTPLLQAKVPIQVDLVLICRKEHSHTTSFDSLSYVDSAVNHAFSQIEELSTFGIKPSVGDFKMAVMGRLLCELGKVGNIEQELKFISKIESDIDPKITESFKELGKYMQKHEGSDLQLLLFEEASKYFHKK